MRSSQKSKYHPVILCMTTLSSVKAHDSVGVRGGVRARSLRSSRPLTPPLTPLNLGLERRSKFFFELRSIVEKPCVSPCPFSSITRWNWFHQPCIRRHR